MFKSTALLTCILFSSSLLSSAFANSSPEWIETKFVVTAYYSPLPNQSFYLRWTYEGDIRLNGNGTHGASGRAVYPGMLAAPKKYAFGTKIFLDGVGLGIVDDRGGAIVEAWERGYAYDRIDIWMGHGEEGLRKALAWGKREVSGRIVTGGETLQSIKFDSSASMKTVSLAVSTKPSTALSAPVSAASSEEYIRRIEKMLVDLQYYDGAPDGKYDMGIAKAIFAFQLDHDIVKSTKDYGAGYLGPKTRSVLAEKYSGYLMAEKWQEELAAKERAEMIKRAELWKKKREDVKSLVESFGNPKDGEIGPHVRKLQVALKKLGYFEGKDTAIFGPKTKDALMQLQIEAQEPSYEATGKLDKSTKEKLVMRLLESE